MASQSSRNRTNGRRAENIVARYLDLWDKRSLSSGAGVGLTDIIDEQRKLYVEVKYGKSAVSTFHKKALQQAELCAKDIDDALVVVIGIPTGTGEKTFPSDAVVVMRPDTFRTLLNIRDQERDAFVPKTLKVTTDTGEEHKFERQA